MRVTDEESEECGKDDKIIASNIQKNLEGEDEFILQNIRLAEAQSRFITGFKTSESNIDFLGAPIHERYFQILNEQDSHVEYHKMQVEKTKLLYALFLLK